MKTLYFIVLSILIFNCLSLNAAIELTCSGDLEIQGNVNQMATLVWAPPTVETDCTDGFQLVQTYGPELGTEVFIGSYYIEYEAFEVCNPDIVEYCSFMLTVTSDRPQDQFIQDVFFLEEINSISSIIDMNNDGLLDIVGNMPNGNLVWYENGGDNNWTIHLISTDYSEPIVVDLDGDGDQDFIVTFLIDSSHDGLGVLINNNNENYTFQLIYDEIEYGFGSQFLRSEFRVSNIFDVDNDGLLDIQFSTLYRGSTECTACMESKHIVAFQNANFDFSTRTITGRDYFRFTDSGSLKSGDFDGDGDPDFVISYADPEDEIELIRNNGNRSFGSYPDAAIDGTDDLSRVNVIDIDEDGDLDITGNRTGGINYFSNNGNGNFTLVPIASGNSLPGTPNLDYDNDGRTDYVSGFLWYENLSNFDFYEHLISDDLMSSLHTILRHIDVDGDGDTDLFVRHLEDNKIYFWENQRIGSNEPVTLEVTCPEEDIEIVGNDDNTVTLTWTLPEVVSNCPEGYEIIQTYGPEQGVDTLIGSYYVQYKIYDNCNPEEITYCDLFIDALSTREPDPFMQFPFSDELSPKIEVIDYDNDGLKDVIGTIEGQGTYWYKNEGNNTWSKTLLTEDFASEAIDMDGDGDIDLVSIFNFAEDFPHANQGIAVLENKGNGAFERHVAFDRTRRIADREYRNSDINIYEIKDMDNNGLMDFVMTIVYDENPLCNSCVENDHNIIFNNGGFDFGTLRIFNRYDETSEPGFMISGDLDNDGDLDILQGTIHPEESLRVYINESNQDFNRRPIPILDDVDRIFRPGLFDVDADGDLDINGAIVNSDPSYFINDGQGNFTPMLIPSGKVLDGTPSVDYDGDGELDIIGAPRQTWKEYLAIYCYYEHEISYDLNRDDHKIIKVLDMDEDGDIDLWVEHINEDRIVYWENKRIDDNVTVALEVTCPEEVLVNTSAASVYVDLELPVVISDCAAGYSIDTLGDLFPDQMYPPGLYTVQYNITDNCNSEIKSCFFDIAIEQIQAGDCPSELPGYSYLGEIDEHKYFLSEERLNWNDASLAAAKIGTYLVAIDDEFENEFLSASLNELAFIGYSDGQEEGNFVWQNGQQEDYENFHTLNSEYGDNAYINFWDGQWGLDGPYSERKYVVELECGNAIDCYLEFSNAEVACFDNSTPEIEDDGFYIDLVVDAFGLRTSEWILTINGEGFTGVYGELQNIGPFKLADFGNTLSLMIEDAEFNCANELTLDLPESCSGMDLCPEELESFSNFGSFENSTYYLYSIATTWQEASYICEQNGGHLVSLESEEENEFVGNLISEIIHIGLNDQSQEGSFEWSGQGAIAYSNFSDCVFCPTNSEVNDYGSMNFWDGSWNVDGPYAERRFLMELTCNPIEDTGVIQPRLAEEQKPFSEIRLYPNPTSGYTTMSMYSENEKSTTLKVYDSHGVERMQLSFDLRKGTNKFTLDLFGLNAGLYFLNVEAQNLKLIKR